MVARGWGITLHIPGFSCARDNCGMGNSSLGLYTSGELVLPDFVAFYWLLDIFSRFESKTLSYCSNLEVENWNLVTLW